MQTKADTRNVIQFTEQNFNEKKLLQQFLLQNDISFIRNASGVYEATIKMTSLEDFEKKDTSMTQSKSSMDRQKSSQFNQSKSDQNKENRSNTSKKGSILGSNSNQGKKGAQNNFQQFLNDKINISTYLNEQKKQSVSPSQNRIRNNSSDNLANNMTGSKTNLNVSSSRQSNYSQSKPAGKQGNSTLSNLRKGEKGNNPQSSTQQQPNSQENQNDSKQQKSNRNYVIQESSPFKTDFQTRWRLNRSRTPESPNLKDFVDTSKYKQNRPNSQASNATNSKRNLNNNENNSPQQIEQQQDSFKKSAYLDVDSYLKEQQQSQRGNSNFSKSQRLTFSNGSRDNIKTEENQFEKSTKLSFNNTQILKKNNFNNTKTEVSPEKQKLINLQKADSNANNSINKGKGNSQFQITLYEDASAFKNRNDPNNESRERKITLTGKNATTNSILKNQNQLHPDHFGKSLVGENKNLSKKSSSDAFNQSQNLWLANTKTASFSKQESIKKSNDSNENPAKKVNSQNENYQTPSRNKSKSGSSKFDKYPSSTEILKNIKKNYMNPVQYPVVQEQYNYTPIENNNWSAEKDELPSQQGPSKQFSFSPDQSNFSPTLKNRQSKMNDSKSAANLSRQQHQNKSPTLSTNQGQSKEFNASKTIASHLSSTMKNPKEFTPDKRGNFTQEDFLPTPQSKILQTNQKSNGKILNNVSTVSSYILNRSSNKDSTPLKNTGLTKSEISLNERAKDSEFKSTQKKSNLKSRSPTPDQSQSDMSINDRLSFFKNSRLSNMPDIKLKVKQNHNYSAVLVNPENASQSRPSSQQQGILHNSSQNQSRMYQEEQSNYSHLNSNQSHMKSVDKVVQPFDEQDRTNAKNQNNSKEQQKLPLHKRSILQNSNSITEEKEPQLFQVDLDQDDENTPSLQGRPEQDTKNTNSNKPRRKSHQRGSVLLLNQNRKNSTLPKSFSRDRFQQDYFSFNSQSNQANPQRVLQSQFLNVNKNDPWLQVFREDDIRMSNAQANNSIISEEQSSRQQNHRYSKIENSPPNNHHNHRINSNHESPNRQQYFSEAAEDINVKQLSSTELVHYYQFILEKAKQNQFQILKNVTSVHQKPMNPNKANND